MGLIIIAVAIALFVLIFAIAGFKIVQQSEVVIIERLGKYSRTLSSGINIIWPIIDKPETLPGDMSLKVWMIKNIFVSSRNQKLI